MSYLKSARVAAALAAGVVAVSFADVARADALGPPPGYYDGVTATSQAALLNQLEARARSGHRQTTYGEARDALPVTDRDPDNPANLLFVYTRQSNRGVWQSGDYQTREHVWPASRLNTPRGDNFTAGAYGDLHLLKPLDQQTNSDRGNADFGTASLAGQARPVGPYWFPGNADRGDVARIAFYTATRWRDDGLRLVDGTGDASAGEMGDLASLLEWHYLDVPDAFERRRNDVIHDEYTNNRNAYIDRPEYVWGAFAGDSDATITVGPASADGGSAAAVDFGRVLVGATAPAAPVTLQKSGVAGTYYTVETQGAAASSVTGRLNAFAVGGPQFATLQVGLAPGATASAGPADGRVVVDNLDVTTGGGLGVGAGDADDVIDVAAVVVNPSNASFSPVADVEALTLDLGTVGLGLSFAAEFSVYNLGDATLTAGLDLDSVDGERADDDVMLQTTPFEDLAGGGVARLIARVFGGDLGADAVEYLLLTSDADDVAGGRAIGDTLALTVAYEVRLAGDANGDGAVTIADFAVLRSNFGGSAATFDVGDFDRDGGVSIADFALLRANFGGTVGEAAALDAWAATVPEPGVAAGVFAAALLLIRRRAA